MQRINFFTLVFLILLIGFVSADKIDRAVSNQVISQGEVRVLIDSDFGSEVDIVSRSELELLDKNSEVKRVQLIPVRRAFLVDSVPLINASKSWNLSVNGISLNGSSQAVCIIDTGVNYSNPSLGGCYGDNNVSSNCKVIGGWDFCADNSICLSDDNIPEDIYGHGTHVSGIVGASGSIVGVAPNTRIVMLKAANSSGFFRDDRLKKAIDWCIDNASIFNISVISMSLGGGLYPSYCDNIDDPMNLTDSINLAVSKNISVVVATGNEGNSSYIASPACIRNSTRVAATNKSDSLASYSNRNNLVKLVAPGTNIISTYFLGSASSSGTSMAAPHVSGAIAIINQYLSAVGKTKTPVEIEQILQNTGKQISDPQNSSQNFSRINVYSAIISLDSDPPQIEMISPINGSTGFVVNKTFSCNISDLSLMNATFRLWNSSGLVNETSFNVSGANYNLSINLSNLGFDRYFWQCSAYDENGNSNSSGNFSLVIQSVSSLLNLPINNSYGNSNLTFFNCSSSSSIEKELSNVTFRLWNSSDFIYNETKLISGIQNSSQFNFTFFNEGSYLWNCLTINNNSESSLAEYNFTFNYDITYPLFNSIFISTTTSSAAFQVNASELVNLTISYGDIFSNSSYLQNNSFSLSGLSAGTSYNYNLTICDLAGNCNFSLGSFITQSPSVVRSSGGGGGGGTVQNLPLVYAPSQQQTFSGYSADLKKDDQVIFTIFDENAQNHTIRIVNITNISVSLVVQSNPVNVTLGIGQSIKLNLSSPEFYNLFLRLDSILNGKAKLTIQTIHELIIPEQQKEKFNESVNETGQKVELTRKTSWTIPILVGLAVVFLVLVFYIFNYFERKRMRRELLRELRKNK